MSKATLTFDLDEPQDNLQHLRAVHADDAFGALRDIDQTLRQWIKHAHEFADADAALQGARDMLHGKMAERGISLEMYL